MDLEKATKTPENRFKNLKPIKGSLTEKPEILKKYVNDWENSVENYNGSKRKGAKLFLEYWSEIREKVENLGISTNKYDSLAENII
jgi:hypothetical protein